jgi:hypothetical protein
MEPTFFGMQHYPVPSVVVNGGMVGIEDPLFQTGTGFSFGDGINSPGKGRNSTPHFINVTQKTLNHPHH